ncbi:MAG: bacterial transcriptional activator domain-containing protein, partial [Cyanobacteria bacterium REEB65]|nr:bacterial transcriptional activator domain-containing protein [Cyanobacteria bacterium REEB65]
INPLRVLASSVRKMLEPDLPNRARSRFLVVRGGRYCLDRAALWLDIDAFEQAAKQGRHLWLAGERIQAAQALEEALLLYRGDLLADTDLLEWFDLERHRYRTLAIAMHQQLAEHYVESGSFEDARSHWLAILALDATDEQAHCGLMRLCARFGQWQRLREQYELMRKAFRNELGCEPSEAANQLFKNLAVPT